MSEQQSSADSAEEKMPVARPVAFRVPRVVNDRLSKTEFRLFDDEDEARRAACDIGADYDGLFLVADRRAAFFAQPRPSTEPQTAPSDIERAFRDACDEAGCAYDNEALLEAIQALKERCQAEIVPVPKAALDWLFGEGVGPDGKWFCDDQDTEQRTPRKYSRAYWWRSKFRSMIPALTRPVCTCGGDPDQPAAQHDLTCPATLPSQQRSQGE
jgi:hypothetical protein